MTPIFKIGLALLVIVAVATVLITPDPTDDVCGIVHGHTLLKLQRLAAVVGAYVTPTTSVIAASLTHPAFASDPATPDLLALVCTRLC